MNQVQVEEKVKHFPFHLLDHEEAGLHGVLDAQGEELVEEVRFKYQSKLHELKTNLIISDLFLFI